MKRNILFVGAVMLATTVAVAKTIDFDTVINWNSGVISAALEQSGFIGSNNAAWDVRVTHERILDELVKKQSFSLRDATRVCLDKCNMSDFLKNGRGQSGKKCPELCTGFADALVAVNNEYNTPIFERSSNLDYNKTVHKKIDAFKNIQVGLTNTALLLIERYIKRYNLARYTVCENSPRCKSVGQDYIHCDLDGVRYLFEFDDICNTKVGIVTKPDLPYNAEDMAEVDGALLDAPFQPHALVIKSAMTLDADLLDSEEIEKALQKHPEEKITNSDFVNSQTDESDDWLKKLNGSTIDWSNVETYSLEGAQQKIVEWMSSKHHIYVGDEIKCTGKCRKLGNDIVTCKIRNNITFRVIFDDICQSAVEDFFYPTPEKIEIDESWRLSQEYL